MSAVVESAVSAFSDVLHHPMFEPHQRYRLPLDDYMALTIARARHLYQHALIANAMWRGGAEESQFSEFVRVMGWIGAYDFALLSAIVDHQIAGNALLAHGRPDQVDAHREEIDTFRTVYCFAATEIGCGSDLKHIGTQAHYDHAARCFWFETPSLEAAKCWIGNSLHSATVAMVLARLIVNGVDEGHHWFRLPLRDAEGCRPYPGIRIRRADPKGGIVANQTGIILFDGYRAPVDTLMGRWASIDESGRYASSFGADARFVACLETFIQERLFPATGAACAMARASAIAVCYAMHRRAFGKALVDHGHYRERLAPMVANAAAARYGVEFLIDECNVRFNVQPVGENHRLLHGVISAFKAAISWQANADLQVLRELCGGHGFHCYNEIVTMRNDFDVNATFAGDNTILCYEAMRIADRLGHPYVAGAVRSSGDDAAFSSGWASTWLDQMASLLLERWRETHMPALCEPFARAVAAAATLRRWSQAPGHGLEQALQRLYGIERVLERLDLFLDAGLIDADKLRAIKAERSRLCQEICARPDELLTLLQVPESLLQVPIASPDYAARTVQLAAEPIPRLH
jgi:acyl-CoA oxidase